MSKFCQQVRTARERAVGEKSRTQNRDHHACLDGLQTAKIWKFYGSILFQYINEFWVVINLTVSSGLTQKEF